MERERRKGDAWLVFLKLPGGGWGGHWMPEIIIKKLINNQ